MARPVSLAVLDGFYPAGRCGYCQHTIKSCEDNESTSETKLESNQPPELHVENEYLQNLASQLGGMRASFGMSAAQVPPELYDKMIQRNFRRSGDFYYWPLNWSGSCCPQYAIRLPASRFQPNKNHRSVLNRFRRQCNGELKSSGGGGESTSLDIVHMEEERRDDVENSISSRISLCLSKALQLVVSTSLPIGISDAASFIASIPVKILRRPKQGDFSCPVIPALIGLCRKHHISLSPSPKELAQKIIENIGAIEGIKEVCAADNGYINFYATPGLQSSPSRQHSSVPPNREQDTGLQRYRLRLVLDQASAFKEDEYQLYLSYQMKIHGDGEAEAGRRQYSRFLCESTLTTEFNLVNESPGDSASLSLPMSISVDLTDDSVHFIQETSGQPLRKLPAQGSFHLRYELISLTDQQAPILLAVSVVDVLPTGLSSVYFFYDTNFKHLSLGVLSAVLEVRLIAALEPDMPSLKYYYMGFYIHRCSKMRYKGKFEPSEILCPITMQWTLLDKRVKDILDHKKYTRLCIDSKGAEAFARELEIDMKRDLIGECLFLYARRLIKGSAIPDRMMIRPEIQTKLKQFSWLITAEFAKQFIYLLELNDIVETGRVISGAT